jgi:hypothetical protein
MALRDRNIGIPSEEYDRERRTEFRQARLKFRTAYPRYTHVEEDAAWDTFARQAIQQVLSRSIGRDVVTGFRQTAFHRLPEGRIVIDYVYEPLHASLPENAESHLVARRATKITASDAPSTWWPSGW